MAKTTKKCSFCGRPESQVGFFIMGMEGAHICDECAVQASDIEITAREIQKLKKELYTIIANHSKNPFERIEKDSDRDYWMTSEEALDYGMIDKILFNEKKK